VETELERAKTAAYRLLSCRRRTKHEIEQRLEQKGFSRDITVQVLTVLADYGYINDREFACFWIEQRLAKKGFRLIKQELLVKGVEAEIIGECLAAAGEEAEYTAAMQQALKKVESSSGNYSFTRLAGFLERRGFSYDTIGRVCRDISGKAGLA